MGCTGSTPAGGKGKKPVKKPTTLEPGKNRFGRIEGLKIEDFQCTNEEGVFFVKHSGEIMGQQFIVESCHNCNIFLLDHLASLTLDNCTNCFVVTGPVASSLFMRDSRDCTLITVSQQIRLRNCANISML
jgi:protein XRP2